jgi:hypothetical protein
MVIVSRYLSIYCDILYFDIWFLTNFLTLAIVQPAETKNFLTLAIVQHAETEHFLTLSIVQSAEILFNRVFTKENITCSLRKIPSPFFLQEFRPLTPLKETDRFTSLMFIRVTKIMCNSEDILLMCHRKKGDTCHPK